VGRAYSSSRARDLTPSAIAGRACRPWRRGTSPSGYHAGTRASRGGPQPALARAARSPARRVPRPHPWCSRWAFERQRRRHLPRHLGPRQDPRA